MSAQASVREQLLASVDSNQYETTLRLTLVLLLLYGAPGQAIGVKVLSAGMLAVPALLQSRHGWAAITAFIVFATFRDRFVIDNHQYLICYWVSTVTVGRWLVRNERRLEFLRGSARALVAIVFVAAAAWKIHGREYADGSFLHYTFLTDSRFQNLTAFLTHRSVDVVTDGSTAVSFLRTGGEIGTSLSLVSSAQLASFTLILSWLGMTIEGVIGLVHVLPGRVFYSLRQNLFFCFVGTTYFIFPVLGFAFILAVMGYAQCAADDRWRRGAFLALIAVVHLTVIPWQQALLP